MTRFRHFVLAAGAALSLAAGHGLAQAISTERLKLSPDQKSAVYQVLKQQRVETAPQQVSEPIAVGSPFPPSVQLQNMPERITAELPALSVYRFAVLNDRVILVDAQSGRVAEIIEPGGK
jgi:hypothetical protein